MSGDVQPAAWAVECPYCGAEPGMWCVSPRGRFRMSWEHVSRRLLTMFATQTEHRCGNCGQVIVDNANSPTGFVHLEHGHSRCDGLRPDSRTYRAPMAVLA